METSSIDVLIIGAGPAGLMCANALAKAGVSVRIIDQRPDKVATGQADGIQPRTIEVLQSYGLAERLLKEGNQMHMAAFYNPAPDGGIQLTDRVPDVTAPTARYPFEVTLHQGAIEAIFLDSMRLSGVEAERPVVPTSIVLSQDESILKDPNSYAVEITLKNLTTETMETVRAKFVVGADGAHSWVRKSFDIAMEGEQTDYVWGVVDMVPITDFPDIRNRCVIHSNNGSCMVIPREGDKVRLYIQLEGKDAVDAKSGRIDKSRVGPLQLLEVARNSFRPYTFETPESFDWWTIYVIGQRVASKYSVNERVFISGDACHTHSPKAGQGMNASMNDTHNLAWKLCHVLRGWADISLLKTYEFERRKYAQDLISFDKQFARLFSGKPRTDGNQDGVSHEDFLKIFQTFGGFTSGIGVHYAPSAIIDTQEHNTNLVVGQRMPPGVLIRAADSRPCNIQDLLISDTRFKLLVFLGNVPPAAVQRSANELEVVLRNCSRSEIAVKFGIFSISLAKKSDVRYTDIPPFLRPHWSSVFIDDVDVTGAQGGNAYASLGISSSGAIVVVRPDGYVGTIAPLEELLVLENYVIRFLPVR